MTPKEIATAEQIAANQADIVANMWGRMYRVLIDQHQVPPEAADRWVSCHVHFTCMGGQQSNMAEKMTLPQREMRKDEDKGYE